MIRLVRSLNAWATPDFDQTLKDEIQRLDPGLLPLQEALSQSSYVSDQTIKVVILKTSESEQFISVKTGIFYSGIIAGACCSDDPTPNCEQQEYCEIQFDIDKQSAEVALSLLSR